MDATTLLYEHFGRHWGDWFSGPGPYSPHTFTRQAANLWAVKAHLRQHLLGQVSLGVQVQSSIGALAERPA
jgi:hypothetical protein